MLMESLVKQDDKAEVSGSSRRRLLAASGAAFALGALQTKSAYGAGRLDAIVVGGGVSGLNTAWLLEQQGLKVLLLEGRKRVGGRVFTLLDEPGYPEMGFNSMAAGYSRGIDTAHRAGVELEDLSPRFASMTPMQLVLGGRVIPRSAWPTDPANPFPASLRNMMPWEVVGRLVADNKSLKSWIEWTDPKNAALDISMYNFLSAQGLDDASIRLAFDVAPYHGGNARDVSALMYQFSDGWTRAQAAFGHASYGVKGGNMRLPMAMKTLIKGDVLFDKRVTSVSSDKYGAGVVCADGTTYRSKRVIMALPFSMVRQIKFEPVLHGIQARAVNTLPYQNISNLFVRAKSPFWLEDKISPTLWTDGFAGMVLAQHFGATPGEVTGLMVSVRGDHASSWNRLAEDDVKAMVVAELERIRPAAKGKLEARFLQRWTLDPFNGGDWAYWNPGQISTFAAAMSKPAGRVHFAGEHTSISDRGLEAALESSERVALEVLSA